MLLANARCTLAATPPCVSMSAHSVAMARLGAVVRRRIDAVRSNRWHDTGLSRFSGGTVMTSSAKAIRIEQPGGPEMLRLAEVPVGEPGPGEIRIRHQACGLNFID